MIPVLKFYSDRDAIEVRLLQTGESPGDKIVGPFKIETESMDAATAIDDVSETFTTIEDATRRFMELVTVEIGTLSD